MKSREYFLEYVPSNSLLVCTPEYTLIRLHIPISAICKEAVAGIKIGERVSIEGVYQHQGETLSYLIDGLRLPYSCFTLSP